MKMALATVTAACSLLPACTHFVNRPSDCAPTAPPAGKPAVGWERVAGLQRVSGRVVAPASVLPLGGASVSLTRLPVSESGNSTGIERVTDNTGAFTIESISPAWYLIRVRRLGYTQVRDTIEVKPDSALAVIVLLVRDNLALDECTLTYQKVRVPWWKRS
jgi:carboxypeptidase family protein